MARVEATARGLRESNYKHSILKYEKYVSIAETFPEQSGGVNWCARKNDVSK